MSWFSSCVSDHVSAHVSYHVSYSLVVTLVNMDPALFSKSDVVVNSVSDFVFVHAFDPERGPTILRQFATQKSEH
jgi:hypothetical protein